nr:hypothetical protein [Tanacetum cinerariifolium]
MLHPAPLPPLWNQSSRLLTGPTDFLDASDASPLGSFVLAKASSDLTKSSSLVIISSTVFGTFSDYHLATCSSCRESGCELQPEFYPSVDASLQEVLEPSLALSSRACWNIRHHTGMGHSSQFAANENRLRWSSGSASSDQRPLLLFPLPPFAPSSGPTHRRSLGVSEIHSPFHYVLSIVTLGPRDAFRQHCSPPPEKQKIIESRLNSIKADALASSWGRPKTKLRRKNEKQDIPIVKCVKMRS